MLENSHIDAIDSARGLMIAMVTSPTIPEKFRDWADKILLDYPQSWKTDVMRQDEADHG